MERATNRTTGKFSYLHRNKYKTSVNTDVLLDVSQGDPTCNNVQVLCKQGASFTPLSPTQGVVLWERRTFPSSPMWRLLCQRALWRRLWSYSPHRSGDQLQDSWHCDINTWWGVTETWKPGQQGRVWVCGQRGGEGLCERGEVLTTWGGGAELYRVVSSARALQ